MKMFIKDLREVLEKIGSRSADAGKSAVMFTKRKIEDNNIQEAARYYYYSQFTNEQLQDMHQDTDNMKEQVSIKDVMRKRGCKYDFEIGMFYPGDIEKVMESEKVHQLERRKIRSYEEIEESLRER